jgi:hypothetical protein
MTTNKKASEQQPPAHLSAAMKKWWGQLDDTFAFEPHQYKLLRLAAEA